MPTRPIVLAVATARATFCAIAITSISDRLPPNGSSLERRTEANRNRLAKPFAISVRSRHSRSSVAVIWPIIEMQAPVARAGEFLVSVARLPRSQASRSAQINIALALHRAQRSGKLEFNNQKPLVINSGINRFLYQGGICALAVAHHFGDRIADFPDDALAARQPCVMRRSAHLSST